MKKGIILFLIAVGVVLIGVSVFKSKDGAPRPSESGFNPNESTVKEIPSPTLKDYQGKEVNLTEFKGKPLVVNSWAVWCPFCVQELKDFAQVQEEFKDEVVIVAVDRAEPLKSAKEYTDEIGLTNKLIFLLDPSDSFYRAIGGFSMPETIFINSQGKVVDHKRGPMDQNEMRQRIQRML